MNPEEFWFRQRQVKAKNKLSERLVWIHEVTGFNPTIEDAATFEETDLLRNDFIAHLRDNATIPFRRNWDAQSEPELQEFLTALATQTGDRRTYLLSLSDDSTMAVSIPASAALSRAVERFPLAADDLALCTEGGGGLCVEFNYYDRNGVYFRDGVYEVRAWGDLTPLDSD